MSNPNINDGGWGYACRKIDVYYPTAGTGGSGVATTYATTAHRGTYILEGCAPRRSLSMLNLRDQLGAPSGGVGQQALPTGSGTVQIPGDPAVVTTPQIAQIQPGDAFNIIFDVAIGAENWLITEVSSPEEQNGIKKMSISFQKLITASCQPTA